MSEKQNYRLIAVGSLLVLLFYLLSHEQYRHSEFYDADQDDPEGVKE